MTLQEFVNLTNVNIDYKEFDAINVVYMNSDVDKYEFCKMWCKMNANRVKAAKASKKAEEEENENKWELANLYWTLHYDLRYEEKRDKMFEDVVSKASLNRVKKAGIETNDYAISVLYDMAQYLGI